RGDDRRIAGVLRKVKWPDKLRNLELLSRHVGTESAALDLELKRLDVAKKRAELKLLENPEDDAPPTSVAVTIIDARVRDADAE
ncbi:TPA: terminase small subunit, partial [Pseudomonas aeruginosa]|nr:terminase small subunit [Pseudomonas aeruginosa]